MTADAVRRRRFTIVGSVLAATSLVVLIAVSVVAVSTLRSSGEGRAPVTETRQVVSFPQTPNAVVAVVDDLDRLSSLAVLTLDPSGTGGSIVVVPVNVDQTNGAGPERVPVSQQPYTPGDPAQAAELVTKLEPLLTLTIERSRVVGPGELATLLEPFGSVAVDLPADVIDSDTPGSGVVARAGESTLDVAQLVAAFTAIDATGVSYDHQPIDAALWSGLAAAAPTGGAESAGGAVSAPAPAPATFDDLWQRLFAGEVAVRSLDINTFAAREEDNSTDADFVLADRPDALLVFGAISPGLVSQPNESLSVRLMVGFDENDVAALGNTADGVPVTKTSMTRRFIGELLFSKANVVGVDLTPTPGAVPPVTRLYVADEAIADQVRALSERFFGDAEIIVADQTTDGVDVVAVLGADFLVQRAQLLDIERADATSAAENGDSAADFDVSGSTVSSDPVPTSTGDTANSGSGVPDSTADTVPDDG